MNNDAHHWPKPWVTVAGSSDAPPGLALISANHGWLGRMPLVVSLIVVYLGFHFLLRLQLSPTLGLDDAEQILFAQQWALGYRFRQPPLFTWLLVPVVDWIGPGVLAVSIVRYALLAVTYGFLYLTALHWIEDRRLAALSTFSFALIYVFAYYAHNDLTHTTALGALIAATLYVFSKLSQQPESHYYLLLGVCFGIGMLTKWNFVMLAIGLPLTCLLLRRYRPLVVTWRSLLTTLMMIVIVSPTALWMFSHGQTAGGVSSTILSGLEDQSGQELMVEGTMTLLKSAMLFPMPFLPIFLAVFGTVLLRRQASDHVNQTGGKDPRFLGWLILAILALHVLLIPIFGAVNFTERWMHPALMPLPIFLFALLSQRLVPLRTISFYLGIIAIFVAVVIGARLYRYAEGADACNRCREFAPFAALAADLRAAGFENGTIIADGMHIGGNLLMTFPESRVIDPAFPLALWPSRDDSANDEGTGMCLLVWRDGQPNTANRRTAMHRFAQQSLDVPTSLDWESGRVESVLLSSSTRRYALGFELIRENAGGCR